MRKKYQAMLFTAYWDGGSKSLDEFYIQCKKRKNVSYRVIDCEEPAGVDLSTKLQAKLLPYLIIKKGDNVVFRGTFKNINEVMDSVIGAV